MLKKRDKNRRAPRRQGCQHDHQHQLPPTTPRHRNQQQHSTTKWGSSPSKAAGGLCLPLRRTVLDEMPRLAASVANNFAQSRPPGRLPSPVTTALRFHVKEGRERNKKNRTPGEKAIYKVHIYLLPLHNNPTSWAKEATRLSPRPTICTNEALRGDECSW